MKFTSAQNKLILETDEYIRGLERKSHNDPEAKARHREELRRILGLEHVESVRCLGIFKIYDYGPDSVNMFFVANKELADIATTMLDENDGGIINMEGGEHSAYWDSKSAIAELDDVLLTDDEVVTAIRQVQEE